MKLSIPFIITLISFSLCQLSIAQQTPRLMHYLTNPSAFNPALAGLNGAEVFAFHRQEFSALDNGKFQTQVAGGSFKPFGNSQRLGLGALVLVDQANLIQNNNFGGTLAYHILDGQTSPHQLSIGILAGIQSQRISYDNAIISNPNDFTLYDRAVNSTEFNYGMGIALIIKMGQKSKLGLNVASTQSNRDLTIFDGEQDFMFGLKRNVIGSAFINVEVSPNFSIEPAVLYKRILEGFELEDDITFGLRGVFSKRVSFGGTYALASGSAGVMLGFQIGKTRASAGSELPMGTVADLGNTFEVGVMHQFSYIDEFEMEKEDKKKENQANKKDKTKKPKVDKKQRKLDKDDYITAEKLRKLLAAEKFKPFKTNISVDKPGLIRVKYEYTDLFTDYYGVDQVNGLVTHLVGLFDEWTSKGYNIKSIRITTNASETPQMLENRAWQEYEGEFGDIENLAFRQDGEGTKIDIKKGPITIQQHTLLKLYRIATDLQFYDESIQLRLNTGDPRVMTTIQIDVEK
ncbi:MAG: PorP/SprF family type IX secretion system membrane protein [Bacteroidota bacterium]